MSGRRIGDLLPDSRYPDSLEVGTGSTFVLKILTTDNPLDLCSGLREQDSARRIDICREILRLIESCGQNILPATDVVHHRYASTKLLRVL